jgi:hypothetical protein
MGTTPDSDGGGRRPTAGSSTGAPSAPDVIHEAVRSWVSNPRARSLRYSSGSRSWVCSGGGGARMKSRSDEEGCPRRYEPPKAHRHPGQVACASSSTMAAMAAASSRLTRACACDARALTPRAASTGGWRVCGVHRGEEHMPLSRPRCVHREHAPASRQTGPCRRAAGESACPTAALSRLQGFDTPQSTNGPPSAVPPTRPAMARVRDGRRRGGH